MENFIFCVVNHNHTHCVKSVSIRSISGPYFPLFGLNTNKKNSEYGHFSRSDKSCSLTLKGIGGEVDLWKRLLKTM